MPLQPFRRGPLHFSNVQRTITLAFFAWLFLLPSPAEALDPVVLQLKWRHAFQFAGYYAAQERGYYREAGLDVRIREAGPGIDVVDQVVSGQAQFGVGTSSLLLARAAGKPVVALAVIFQHSALGLAARGQGALQTVHDLVGKRLMVEPQSDELFAYFRQEGIAPERLTFLDHSFNIDDLIEGRVDAASVYMTNEPYFLDRAGVDYQIHTPRSVGIDFYGDNLFTSEAELRERPDRVAAFRAASLRGWEYAMAHPEEVVDLILRKYARDEDKGFLEYEARHMAPLIRIDLIEVGYMNPGRWAHIADTYADLGLLPRTFAFDGFLYDPGRGRPDFQHLAPYLAGALAAVLLASGIALYILRINRRLTSSMRQLRQTAADLATSEERYRLLAEHASDVIWTMDLEGRFTYVSPSVEKLRGFSVAEVMGQSIHEALTPESATIAVQGLRAALDAVQAGLEIPPFRGELEQPCKDGSTVWTEVTVTGMTNSKGEFAGMLGVTRDITQRRRAEERIRHMAQHDPLTDLPNRALFSDRLEHALAVSRRTGRHLAVMFLDLDRFKPINDRFGHDVGDLLLKAAARRIRDCLRESDTVARIGGDEFVLLLADVDHAEAARKAAEKVRHSLDQPFMVAGHELAISASIGIALFPDHGETELELAKSADTAMYVAKREGRNGCRVFEPA